MRQLAEEIRDYLRLADIWLRIALEDGSLTITEAKVHAAELEKWQERLRQLESQLQ